ncbi:MAG: YncE family protein [Bryobacteraceae bacterium]|nr:YncE family protein [Bryobacteraceae bacterium]
MSRFFLTFAWVTGCLPAQTFLYVSSLSTDSSTITTVYNTADRSRVATTGLRSGGIAVAPDGRSYFVTDANGASVALYNAGSAQALITAATGGSPAAVTVAPNGQRIYVAGYAGGLISLHDARTLALLGTVASGFSPAAIAVHPDNSRFYVAHASDRDISVYSVSNLRLVSRISTSGGVVALQFLNNRTLLAADSGGETVLRIDTDSDTIETRIDAGPEPAALAVRGDSLYVSNSVDSIIRIFSATTGRATGQIQLPRCPWRRCAVMSLAVDGSTLYAANSNQREVFAIDLNTNQLTATFDVPQGPRWIAVGSAPRP